MQHTFLVRKYSQLLKERPLATRSWTSAVVLGVGDILAQFIENYGHEERTFSPIRSLKMSFVGLTVIGPNGHGFFKLAEKVCPGTSMNSVFKKLAMDQFLFAPYIISVNFTTVGLINGKSMEDIKHKIVQDLTPTFKRDASLWLPANFIGFRFVPYEFRMLYTNVVALVWNTYLSIVNHRNPSPLPSHQNTQPHVKLKMPCVPLLDAPTATEDTNPITIEFQPPTTQHVVHVDSAVVY